MRYRELGRTGIEVSEIAFGAGPVSGGFTEGAFAEQLALLQTARYHGINWIDTAAGYGEGRSEENLGRVLGEFDANEFHIATKVRLQPTQLDDIASAVAESVRQSLRRLHRPKVSLLQLHNAITTERGQQPFSIAPSDILKANGVLAAFQKLQREGLIDHFGLTGIGEPSALRTVIETGEFATVQTPFHILDSSRGCDLAEACAKARVGVFAIRVFAAGAIVGQEPSAHTRKTPFFPMSVYERDCRSAALLRERMGERFSMTELAVRYVLSQPNFSSAIIGFRTGEQLAEVVEAANVGPLTVDLLREIESIVTGSSASPC